MALKRKPTGKKSTTKKVKKGTSAVRKAIKETKDKTPRRKSTGFKRSKVLEDKVLKNIEKGLSNDVASILSGITEETFRRWRKCESPKDPNDLEDIEPEMATTEDLRCWECGGCGLQMRMREAEYKFEQRHLDKIDEAANAINDKTTIPNWEASAWLLERKFKTKYAKKSINDVTSTIDVGSENAKKLAAAIIKGAIGSSD